MPEIICELFISKMKKLTIISIILLAAILYYFFAPTRWTLGLRAPKNYQECVDAGGMVSKVKYGNDNSWYVIPRCVYKDLHFEVLPGNI